MGLNRTSLYAKPKEPSEREVQISRRIDEIYTECPFYGSPKIKAQLKREGWSVNRKLVQRLMRQMGIASLGATLGGYPTGNTLKTPYFTSFWTSLLSRILGYLKSYGVKSSGAELMVKVSGN